MKDPKKVEADKRLAGINRSEEERRGSEWQNEPILWNWGCKSCGGVGGLGYYIYQTKKGEQGATARWGVRASTSGSNLQTHNKIILNHAPRLTSLRWIKSLLFYKNGQEEYSK